MAVDARYIRTEREDTWDWNSEDWLAYNLDGSLKEDKLLQILDGVGKDYFKLDKRISALRDYFGSDSFEIKDIASSRKLLERLRENKTLERYFSSGKLNEAETLILFDELESRINNNVVELDDFRTKTPYVRPSIETRDWPLVLVLPKPDYETPSILGTREKPKYEVPRILETRKKPDYVVPEIKPLRGNEPILLGHDNVFGSWTQYFFKPYLDGSRGGGFFGKTKNLVRSLFGVEEELDKIHYFVSGDPRGRKTEQLWGFTDGVGFDVRDVYVKLAGVNDALSRLEGAIIPRRYREDLSLYCNVFWDLGEKIQPSDLKNNVSQTAKRLGSFKFNPGKSSWRFSIPRFAETLTDLIF